MNAVLIVLPILTLLMFELGLTLNLNDFKLFMKRPKPVIAGLVGQLVFLPVLAFILARLFGLEAVFFIGMMLIACSPGGSSSNVFSMLAGGDVALSVSLTACSSILTLFTIPLIMGFVTQQVGIEADIHLPVGSLIMQNIVLMLVPIALGIFIRRKYDRIAEKMHRVLAKIAFPALMLLAGIFFVQHRDTIVQQFGTLGACVSILILLSMAGGALLAVGFGLTNRERKTLVIEVGMQNAAQAIAVASSPFVFNNDLIAVPAIVYALMMNVILLGYVGLQKWVVSKQTVTT